MKGLLLLLSFLLPNIASGQSTITVVDESDQPLVGVSVFSRDKTFMTITNVEGMAHLPKGIPNSTTLFLQYLGYKGQQWSVSELRAMDFKVQLEPGLELDEVVIVGRSEESNRMVNRVHKVAKEEIQLMNQQTPADILAASGQVYVQKSQMGGGSPVLRGFEANKVLLVVDGVRMNNAIYRNGHLQNAITIDGSSLDNISVIFGPGSLKYGSDAIGGVMHFETKMPRLSLNDGKVYNGMIYSRYASANEEKTLHGNIEIGGKKWASWTSVTASSYGNLRTGSHRNSQYPEYGKRSWYVEQINDVDTELFNEQEDLQIGTAYDQLDLLQKVLFQKNNHQKILLNLQFSTSSDIPRYDALTERGGDGPRWAEWDYGPQKRWLSSLSFMDSGFRRFSDKINTIIAFQEIHETRINRRFNDDLREIQDEQVNVLSMTTDVEKSLGELQLQYGVEAIYNAVNSTATGINIFNGQESTDILTRYPSGDNTMNSLAFYVAGDLFLSERNKILGGIRWTGNTIDFNYLRSDAIVLPDSYYSGISSDNQAITWSLGWRHQRSRYNLQAMVATAFRSPNIDDMAKIRINGLEVTVPNPALTPEKTLNTDLTVTWSPSDNISWTNSIFYTWLTDAIVRADFAFPDGTKTFIDGPDTLAVVSNVNAQEGKVYGISSQIKIRFSSRIQFDAGYNWTRGRIDDGEETPLGHIPPSYGRIGLHYHHQDMDGSLQFRYNLAKSIDEYGGSVDNPEYATPDGALSWYTVNYYHKWKINDRFHFDVSIENIANIHYRTFASGVSAPGRNVIFTARFLF